MNYKAAIEGISLDSLVSDYGRYLASWQLWITNSLKLQAAGVLWSERRSFGKRMSSSAARLKTDLLSVIPVVPEFGRLMHIRG